ADADKAVFGVLVALALLAIWRAWRTGRTAVLTLGVVGAVGLAAGLLSVSRIEGIPYRYLIWWLTGLSVVLGATIVAALVPEGARVRTSLGAVLAGALGVLAVVTIWPASRTSFALAPP